MTPPVPRLPDYGGACVSGVVPALMSADRARVPAWVPDEVRGAKQVVLLVLDGLGWAQLQERLPLAPAMAGMSGQMITTVVPSTTATALASIVSGSTPAQHGILGFSLYIDHGEVLNVLRWSTPAGDARTTVIPEDFLAVPPFGGTTTTAIVRNEFLGSGFTRAHLRGANLRGWRVTSTLVVGVRAALRNGERFVYAYYDGIDNVAHAFGLHEHYDAEISSADRLVAELLAELAPGTALLVTADHGQVDVARRTVAIDEDLLAMTKGWSGEPRFHWLHARRGVGAEELATAAREAHGSVAWVRTRSEAIADGWFGGPIRDEWQERLGDVVLACHEPVAFWDVDRQGPVPIVSLHGSLTEDEMNVPLLAALG